MPSSSNERRRSGVRICLGVLFAVAFTLGLTEFSSFLATKAELLLFNDTPWYTATLQDGNNWRTDDQSWGAWHSKYATDRAVTECYDVVYQSNNVGARDTRDYDGSLEPDSIALIGDSFAEGFGVDIEHTFAELLEQRTGRTVLNFGAAGYVGPVQEDLIYRELASRFPHNELIYLFLPHNDFMDNAPQYMSDFGDRYRPYFQRTDDGYAVVYPEKAVRGAPYPGTKATSLSDRLEIFLRRYTYTANTLRTMRHMFAPIDGYGTDDASLVEGTLFFVDRLISAAESKRVTVIVIPTGADMRRISQGFVYQDKSWYVGLKQIAANHGARFIDLALHTPENDYNRFYLPCDGHWSPEGHAFAVERFLMHP